MKHELRKLSCRLLAALSLAALAALQPAGALAQCPMCRTAVEHAGAAARTLNFGIVVLLVPPVAIFCSIFAVAYKKVKIENESEQYRER
ncbi:MAG: hypothetical protein M3444_13145 [Acidobacteriota bacterium]|nr:hypothetical protein [Acidobacteriota bacterium]MDQ5837281.1 hypothetical protein [Acidobacteriota bacterium]